MKQRKTRYTELIEDSMREIKTFIPSSRPANKDVTGIVKKSTTDKVYTGSRPKKETD